MSGARLGELRNRFAWRRRGDRHGGGHAHRARSRRLSRGRRRARATRLGGESVHYILKKRQQEAGVEGITPHDFRRGYVSGLLAAGVDVFTVQKMAGHADAVTTARYELRQREDCAAVGAHRPTGDGDEGLPTTPAPVLILAKYIEEHGMNPRDGGPSARLRPGSRNPSPARPLANPRPYVPWLLLLGREGYNALGF